MTTTTTSGSLIDGIKDLMQELNYTKDIAKDQIEFFRVVSKSTSHFKNLVITQDSVNKYKKRIIKVFNCIRNNKLDNLDSIQIGPKSQLLWRVHMLNPRSYYKDCLKSFGIVIPFIVDKQQLSDLKNGKIRFEENDFNKTKEQSVDFKISIRLDSAVKRQISFMMKMMQIFNGIDVKNDRSYDDKFKQALMRYCAFLNLEKINIENKSRRLSETDNKPGRILLVPRLDIDLLWHSHQLNPTNYHTLSKRLFNSSVFNHSDNIKATTLNESAVKTETLWNEHYSEMDGIGKYNNDSFGSKYDDELKKRNEKIAELSSDNNNNDECRCTLGRRQKNCVTSVIGIGLIIGWGALLSVLGNAPKEYEPIFLTVLVIGLILLIGGFLFICWWARTHQKKEKVIYGTTGLAGCGGGCHAFGNT